MYIKEGDETFCVFFEDFNIFSRVGPFGEIISFAWGGNFQKKYFKKKEKKHAFDHEKKKRKQDLDQEKKTNTILTKKKKTNTILNKKKRN